MNRLTVTGTKFLTPMTASKEELIAEIKRHQKYYDKLAVYEDLEEQGLLIKLPCKVGTEIFAIDNLGQILKRECCGFSIFQGNKLEIWYSWVCEKSKLTNAGIFNKEVFLTREEAEKALSEDKQ